MTAVSELWLIEPRDPLVFGHGGPPGAVIAHRGVLPPPSTVAGMVRAAFVAGQAHVSATRAAELLERISIRGPWLRGPTASGDVQPWFPAPHDGVRAGERFLRAQVEAPGFDEGVLWPAGAPRDLHLVHLAEREDGVKTGPIPAHTPMWPFGALIRWALGGVVAPGDVAPLDRGAAAVGGGRGFGAIADREYRTHVAIDRASGVAVPGALFTSPGTRFERDFELVVEVARDQAEGARLPGTVVLGGESRLSFRRVDPNLTFPRFEDHEAAYRDALARPGRRGLRVQLLTPACLRNPGEAGPWLPPSPPIDGLELVAACIPGPSAISGWDMQAADGSGAPRAVRRLVPAGSVYYYALPVLAGVTLDEALLEACRALWGRPIEPGQERTPGDVEQHLAPPARDGFGLVLPGFWFEGDSR